MKTRSIALITMSLPLICLLALAIVLVVSCASSVNVGLLAFAAAWVIGVYVAPAYDSKFNLELVLKGFPIELFLTLAGTTLLFAAAQTNGTLEAIVDRGVRLCGRRTALVPVAFFLLSAGVAAIGAGNIAATALIAPSAMAVGARLGISPLLSALSVAHGSVAGALTPLTPIGVVIVNNLQAAGLGDAAWIVCGQNFAVNCLVGGVGYVALGGLRAGSAASAALPTSNETARRWTPANTVTTATIGLIFTAVVFGKLNLGFAALAACGLLFLARIADEKAAFRAVPWGVVLMVCGVTTLVKLTEAAGGLELMSKFLSQHSTRGTVNGLIAFVTGTISVFSSTSGVVLPTFLPMVAGIAEQVGCDARGLASSVVIGSNLVDVSPLSTIGALCVAAAPASVDTRRLFNQTLIWGFAMAPLAAVICGVLLR